MFAGGVLSWLVLLPLLTILGAYITVPFPPIHPNFANNPATGMPFLISEMAPASCGARTSATSARARCSPPASLRSARTIPTIVVVVPRELKASARGAGAARRCEPSATSRRSVVLGRIAAAGALPRRRAAACRRRGTSSPPLLIIVFGFFFVTVSSRIAGLIGTSSNPISGMTIATLILTCLIFVALGWTGDAYGPIALCVGAVVCIAAANAGATSQDLKTGYLVGATPLYQQIGLVIGVITSALVIGLTTLYLHQVIGDRLAALPAPQATLMATIIKGLLSQNLPWGLVLVGVFISITLELCGIHSLSFAVGSYLPIATTAPIFAGGLVRWFVERRPA